MHSGLRQNLAVCRCKSKELTFDKKETASLIGLNSASSRSELDTVSQQIEYISSLCI